MPETPPLTIDRRRLASWTAATLGLLVLPPAASGAVPPLALASWFKVDEARSAD